MFQQLIDSINQNSTVKIAGKKYKVLSKTHYANVENPDLKYTKFILNDNSILVVNAGGKSIFLGKIVDDFYKKEYFPEKFVYEKKHFKIFEKDYQIVLKIDFGDPARCEGECVWVDYVCDEDTKVCIDMAYVYKTKSRADILARWIDIEDIKVENKTKGRGC